MKIDSKYKYFYVNGSSFTEGGGLEEPSLVKKSWRNNHGFRPVYEEHYGVTWKTRKDVNWGTRLSEIIGIPCTNEALSGGGVNRIVRMTYDFIYNNWSDKDKFFIILELPDFGRSEFFYNKYNEYYLLNFEHSPKNFFNTKELEFNYATRNYFHNTLKKRKQDEVDQDVFKEFFERHFDAKECMMNEDKSLLGLYSFCKVNDIKLFLDRNPLYFFDGKIISVPQKFTSIHNYCRDNKLQINHDMEKVGFTDYSDGHPGYFGHIEYAKELAKWIEDEE